MGHFSTAELYRHRRRRCRRHHCRGTKSNYMLLNVDPLQKKLAMSGQCLIFLSVRSKHNHLPFKRVKCTQFWLFWRVFATFLQIVWACKNNIIKMGSLRLLINCLMLFFENSRWSGQFLFSQLDKGRSFLKEFRQGRSDVSLIGSFHDTVFG